MYAISHYSAFISLSSSLSLSLSSVYWVWVCVNVCVRISVSVRRCVALSTLESSLSSFKNCGAPLARFSQLLAHFVTTFEFPISISFSISVSDSGDFNCAQKDLSLDFG